MTTILRLSLCAIALSVIALSQACGGVHIVDGSDSGASGSSGDGDGDDAPCTADSTDVIEAQANYISNLSVVGDTIVYLSSDPARAEHATIESIDVDGDHATTLYSSTGDQHVRSAFAHEDDVFFVLENRELTLPTFELWSVPLEGGDAARIGTGHFPNGYIFGADDTHVFIAHLAEGGALFQRADIASGVLEHMAFLDGSGSPYQVSLSGDDVFFIAGFTVSRPDDPHEVYTFTTHDFEATPTSLWVIDDRDVCFLSRGGLLATPSKIACAYSGVGTRERNGTRPRTLIQPGRERSNLLVATDAEDLYLIESVDPMAEGDELGRMKRLSSWGGRVAPIVCDLGKVANKLVNAAFPRQNEYEVVVGDSSVFWVEERIDGSEKSYLLRSADK